MATSLEQARLTLDASGIPYSPRYGDVYNSRAGGFAQACEVFIAGNGLPQRWAGRGSFVILETGFGLGTNFLATWAAWKQDPARPQRLHFVSIEKSPFPAEDLLAWHERDGRSAPLARALAAAWPPATAGLHRLAFDEHRVLLTLAFGDASALIGQLRMQVDAFYLDGFAPSRNPDMWAPRLLKGLARSAAIGATFSTYTVARSVADGLAEAGFRVWKSPGFAEKRAKLAGVFEPRYKVRRREPPAAPSWSARSAIVIGAGIAGLCVADSLAARGWRIDLVEAERDLAQAGSSTPAGALHPIIARDDSIPARFARAAFLHTRRRLRSLEPSSDGWLGDCGHFHCARSAEDDLRAAATVDALRMPPEFVEYLSAADASDLAGARLSRGGYWFPGGAWMRAAGFCRSVLAACGDKVHLHLARRAVSVARVDAEWELRDHRGDALAQAPVLVLAPGAQIAPLVQAVSNGADSMMLPALRRVRGQMTGIPSVHFRGPRMIVGGQGYCLPGVDGTVWCGSTYAENEDDAAVRDDDHRENLRRLASLLPEFDSTATWKSALCKAHVGVRSVTRDRLPLVGPLADARALSQPLIRSRGLQLIDLPRVTGLFVAGGMASRGLTWSALAAEAIASFVEGDPLPLENDLLDAIDPARFFLRPPYFEGSGD